MKKKCSNCNYFLQLQQQPTSHPVPSPGTHMRVAQEKEAKTGINPKHMYTCGEVELDNEEQGKATPGQ